MTAPAGGPLPDESGELVQLDPAALYLTHRDAIWRSARKVLGSGFASEVERVVQQVAVILVRQHRDGKLTPKDNWEAYLRRVAKNEALAVIEDLSQTDSLDQAEEEGRLATDPLDDPVVREAEHRGQVAALASALDRLDDRQRRIVLGSLLEEMSNRQLGSELGVTGQRIGQIRTDALRILARELGGDNT